MMMSWCGPMVLSPLLKSVVLTCRILVFFPPIGHFNIYNLCFTVHLALADETTETQIFKHPEGFWFQLSWIV